MPTALAVFAHPDDIEFRAAGTLLLLKDRGWDVHYCNLSRGDLGSATLSRTTTAKAPSVAPAWLLIIIVVTIALTPR